MARLPRLILPGQAHHVLQRGNNRQRVFGDDLDRQAYLDALREATRLHAVRVHAYALQDAHVHLLATPQESDGLARAMQTLGRRYVAYFNRRHGRSGTLWEGRFRTALIEAPTYVLEMIRYIEQHPLRASSMGDDAGATAWTSARHHLGQWRDPLISEHPEYWRQGNTPFEREAQHRAALLNLIPLGRLEVIRRHVHSGWPLVSAELAKRLGAELERPMGPQKAGRRATSDHSVPN